ncbi:D-glycero-beta-D-manno-heptose 1,7-bisphosphate 7-phosphatase [Aromatoleum evansii]|uniref:D,D-heptose 1,7-bisphosphate phosphatase n=1 Tax=Aromatoleum evansii TaxID=59406 RepID=A0ABZ1ARE4_AROEV|nr:D-glycero-beta-D-manno-heptose 1,7-bisphosphate 7-phosphatase [Aromatoleum evansii]NMG30525.1 D-glycero-beta-D-manno-heptose 1,7-bisphosphate 7-phosphatase [Aromatoleum evansii]WRL47126.1 D-glycero-beta-D-manno-heptose 1,7-bisphosphate 7-phosphatase [Aromatoleum evansii]
MPQKLIILDRDGVINYDSDQFIKSPDEWKPIPGSLEAIARLNQWGWRVVVASNQSGVGRGLFGMDTLNAINEKMVKSLAQVGGRLDAIFFCPHSADSTCDCRKPKPGLFLQIAERFNANLDRVPVVGDSLRDLQAGVAVGCKPYLVLTGKGMKTRDDPALPEGTLIYPDLAALVADLTA